MKNSSLNITYLKRQGSVLFFLLFAFSAFSFEAKYISHYTNLLNKNLHLAASEKKSFSFDQSVTFYQENTSEHEYQEIAQNIFDKDKLNVQKYFPVLCALSTLTFFVPCQIIMQKIFTDLEPRCNKVSIANLDTGYIDANPCYAGGKLAINSLPKNSWGRNKTIDIFLTNLWSQVQKSESNDQIDLYEVYGHSLNQANPKEFLAIMTFLLTAKNIGAGTIDDFTSYRFSQLMKQRTKANIVLAELVEMKEIKNSYVAIQKWANQKKITFKIKEQKIKADDRHRMMGIFLACHFNNKLGASVPTQMFPILLGVAYESMDFISHMKEGTSFKKSMENFLQDVNKYKEAAFFAQKFCL